MRIIQVVPSLRLGGAEIMCENLTYQLMALGHEVTVACLYDTDSPITERLRARNADLRFFGKREGVDLSMIGKLRRLFERERPDVVHTHTHTVQYAAPAARMERVPGLVHTVHNIAAEDQIKPIRMACAYFFKHWGLVPVALSEEIRATVEAEYGLKKDAIPVVYNGIDLDNCVVKRSYQANASFSIVHVGRFNEQKNHEGLIRAFAIFNSAYPESSLALIGDGPLRERTEELARTLGIAGSVRFLGEQPSVYAILGGADLFTLPSNFEGMPMALIEAMGTGLPIVATGVGGVPDMLRDGEDAWLTANDPARIAEAFLDAARRPEERALRGRAALLRSERFSARSMALSYLDIYEGLTR